MSGPFDLIAVGGGPTTLRALADLDTALARRPVGAPVRVAILDPAQPGPGAVWDPAQPAHLRLNVDASIVDLRCPSVPWTFNEWRVRRGSEGAYPPRAEAGRYLAWAHEGLSRSPRLDLTHAAVRVTEVRRVATGWECVTVDAAGAPGATVTAPRVLLATGHAGGAGIDHAALADPARGVAPGATAHVTGAALTAFDVVLDLTEGRGGTWTRVADGVPSYRASGLEPSRIVLHSRTGEAMLPKPVSAPAAMTSAVREVTREWRAGSRPDDAWWDVLARAAQAAASSQGVTLDPASLWPVLDGESPAGGFAERGEDDARRARGEVDADPAWWWGRAWSAGYADVVRSLERAPRDRETWTRWRARAARLERWAFGPPLETHLSMVALHRAGLLSITRDAVDDARETIHAVTRGPGVLEASRPWDPAREWPSGAREPWRSLLESGHATVRPGERGVLTTPEGTCVGADGEVRAGLSALGRPTEGPVIGHDSLQRRLHQDASRWAEALVGDLAARRVTLAGVGA